MKICFSKTFLIWILIVINACITGYSQTPLFASEKIEIAVNDGYYEICGDYFFRNLHSTPIKKNLFYPFAIDSNLNYPDSILVINQKNEKISFARIKNGIYFPIEIPPKKTISYGVIYTQNTTNNKAEYILTTTQKWGRALDKANFIIKIPIEFELKSLSYHFDSKEKVNDFIVYKFHKENFMPKKNLVVEWARR